MGLIEDFHTDRSKVIKTTILCFAYITLGFGIAVLGPTLLDLSYLDDSNVSTLTYLLATRAIGTLISCFLTDLHKKYLSFEKILAFSQFIMGVTLFIFPFFDLIGMNIVIFIYGYASGCFQVFGDLWTIRIWNKKRAAIYIQYIYFFFSLGAFVAPLLASPFLLPATKNNNPFDIESDEFDFLIESNNGTNSTGIGNTDQPPIKHTIVDLKVMYPYMISGLYAMIISAILYLFDRSSNYCGANEKNGYRSLDRQNCDEKSTGHNGNEKSDSTEDEKNREDEKSSLLKHEKKTRPDSTSILNSAEFQVNSSTRPNFLLIKILSVLFVNLFIGFDVTFGTYLSVFVFVNDDFQMSTQQGAFITSAFWFSYSFAFRVPGYFIIQKYGPDILMNIEMLITFFSTVLLTFLIFSNSLVLLWTAVILEGLGMSIVYSTYLAYLKTKFEPSAKLASAFVCAFNIGSFLYPTVVGLYIEKFPIIFIYLCIFCCFATTFTYLYVRWLFRKWK